MGQAALKVFVLATLVSIRPSLVFAQHLSTADDHRLGNLVVLIVVHIDRPHVAMLAGLRLGTIRYHLVTHEGQHALETAGGVTCTSALPGLPRITPSSHCVLGVSPIEQGTVLVAW